MNSEENSNEPQATASSAADPAIQELLETRKRIREALQELTSIAGLDRTGPPPMAFTFDIGLDDDLLKAFNAGLDQTMVLMIQVVRLLRQVVAEQGDVRRAEPEETTEGIGSSSTTGATS